MSSTYLELTNKLLRRIGEVEMTNTDFASARNVQALAKDAIVDTINKINARKFDWPFNAYEHTITLDIGVNEYAWPSSFKKVDLDSFQIQKDPSLSVNDHHLEPITRDEWYKKYRDSDYDSVATGRGIPDYVFIAHGQGFGLTPNPDKAYTLKYRYFVNPTQLSLYGDTTTIPVEFEYVIIDGALYHMNMFRENDNSLAALKQTFDEGISEMTNVLLIDDPHMYDTRVNY